MWQHIRQYSPRWDVLRLCRRTTHGQVINAHGRLSDTDWYRLTILAASTDPGIQSHVVTDHWPQGRRPDDHPGLSDLGL